MKLLLTRYTNTVLIITAPLILFFHAYCHSAIICIVYDIYIKNHAQNQYEWSGREVSIPLTLRESPDTIELIQLNPWNRRSPRLVDYRSVDYPWVVCKFCLLWIDKARAEEKAYIWVSVRFFCLLWIDKARAKDKTYIYKTHMSVIKDYKLKLRKLRASHTLGWSWNWNT